MNTSRAEELVPLQVRMSELRAYLKRLSDREAELRPRRAELREERAAFLSRTLLPELAALEGRLSGSRARIRALQSRVANLRNLSGRVGNRVMHVVDNSNLTDVEARLEEEKSAYRMARDELRAEFARLRARWVEEVNRLYPRDPATSAELAKIAAEIARVKGQVDLTVLQTISVLAWK